MDVQDETFIGKRDIRQRRDKKYEVWAKLSAIGVGVAPFIVKDKDGKDLKYKRTLEPCYVKDYPVDVIVYSSMDLRYVLHHVHYEPVIHEWRQ